MSTSRVDAKDPIKTPEIQRGPIKDHMPLVFVVALDQRHDERCPQVRETRRNSTDDGNVPVVRKLWKLGVVILKDTEREGKA